MAVLLLLATLITVEGCCDPGDYDKYTLKKGIAHFSFEYPCSYDRYGSEINEDDCFTLISIRGPYHKSVEDRTWLRVFVLISEDPGFLDPERALKQDVSHNEKLLDYRLIERSSVNVAGIEGQQIIYFYNRERPGSLDPGFIPGVGPAPTIAREIYFCDEGRIWDLQFHSNESTAEADMADFEHMLETFTILN